MTHAPVRWLKRLGPGLITGAADDDPGGIATYSQAGAQYGYGTQWSLLAIYPLAVSIQVISARIGRVTGRGLAANLQRHGSAGLLRTIVGLLLFANIVNLSADLAAMAEAVELLIGGPGHLYAVLLGLVSLLLQIYLPYERYVRGLKWLTLSLFSYVATALTIEIPWSSVAHDLLMPPVEFDHQYAMVIVAVLGTTVSPYLFFWQATQEAHIARQQRSLRRQPKMARPELGRIKLDTLIGMGFSSLVAFFIMTTTAATLHTHGVDNIETTRQAAEALRPLAGELTYALFSLGIIGTGLLAVPVLAGSAAYAVAESLRLPAGLDRHPMEARGFYFILSAAMVIGALLDFAPIDPMKLLFASAIVNGVVAVPIMAAMLRLSGDPAVMGPLTISPRLRWLGWLATTIMALAAALMFWQA